MHLRPILAFLLIGAACRAPGEVAPTPTDAPALTDAVRLDAADATSPDAGAGADADAADATAAGDAATDAATDATTDAATAAIDATADAAIDAIPIDGPPPLTAPVVVSLDLPTEPAGVIDVRVVVLDATSATIDLTVELSCDGVPTWRPATITSDLTDLAAGPTGTSHTLRWDSFADVAFHQPHACALRAIATDPDGLVSAPRIADVTLLDNLRAAARNVDDYLIHYGPYSTGFVDTARRYQLVILDPRSANLSRDRVASVQRGVDPADPADDVIVLCYVSIGEDIRTASRTDAQLLADPRFVGDGTGPRVDPRGPGASGDPLDDLDPLGLPSEGGSGYASFYLDDNDVLRSGDGDGRPDRNAHFGGAFVNAGDPAWYDALEAMTLDGPDGVAGLDEILTEVAGRGLGCDGAFLDTYDTAAPNAFTDLDSSNLSQFEWTAPGFLAFTQRLRASYPEKVFLQNRGLFFFDPRHPQFAFTTGALIDYSLYESFRLDSSSAHEYVPTYYADNRYNVAPKLMAEANRGRGFRVLSLGYAEGPADVMSELTLVGQSTLGLASLLEDIRVAQAVTGFRHYLSNSSLTRTNTFVMDQANLDDIDPPQWTSTYNDHNHPWPTPADAPTPRIGVQQVIPRPVALTVRWDVALDRHRVRYVAYYQAASFDFVADPFLTHATRVALSPRMGPGYVDGVGPGRFPYEADLIGLAPGTTYHVIIRAYDDSPNANQDTNQRVLSATPIFP